METSIFSEYKKSDYDLKILIIKTAIEFFANTTIANIKDLAIKLNPNLETNLFIKELLVFVPELRRFGVEDERLSPSDQLKLAAINLNTFLNNQNLSQIMTDTRRIVFSSQLLGLRYGLATGFIEKTLNEKTNGEPEIIVKKLSQFITNGIDADLFETINFAEKEILRVTNNQKTSQVFNQIMISQIEQMELYFDSIMGKRIMEMLQEVLWETLDKSLPNLFDNLNISQHHAKQISRVIKSTYSEYTNQSKKEKFVDLRGGTVPRKGFNWTDEKLVEFYKKVEDLPKIKNKSVWEFAAEKLIEMEFDSETIRWVKSRPAFRDVPDELFNDAVKKWRKYEEVSEIFNDEDKPRFFEFRHALHLLNYPDNFKFNTLRNRYFAGQNLCKNQ